MAQNDDAETDDHGILEGSGPGGGASDVQENRVTEERGGSRAFLCAVIALVIALAVWPILRLFGVAAETPALNWMYVVTLFIALAILVPFVYGLIKKST